MNKKRVRIIEEYRADELGLPILFKGVPVIEVDGHEVIDIDYDKISKLLFAALILKPYPLTGAEVRFMRLLMGMTLENLAKCLHVTHPTVLSWEKCENKFTKMTDSTEAIFRIFSAQQGARDSELIGVILNRFFIGPSEVDATVNCATIVELNAKQAEEAPNIRFSNEENDLRFLRGA